MSLISCLCSYVQVSQGDFWKTQLASLRSSFHLELCSPRPCSAIIDSGTSLISVPHHLYRDLLNNIITEYECQPSEDKSGLIVCDCSHGITDFPMLSLEFEAGDAESVYLELHPIDYLLVEVVQSQRFCVPQIMSLSMHNFPQFQHSIVLGDTLLRAYVTQFDFTNHRIGFSRSLMPPPTLPDIPAHPTDPAFPGPPHVIMIGLVVSAAVSVVCLLQCLFRRCKLNSLGPKAVALDSNSIATRTGSTEGYGQSYSHICTDPEI